MSVIIVVLTPNTGELAYIIHLGYTALPLLSHQPLSIEIHYHLYFLEVWRIPTYPPYIAHFALPFLSTKNSKFENRKYQQQEKSRDIKICALLMLNPAHENSIWAEYLYRTHLLESVSPAQLFIVYMYKMY